MLRHRTIVISGKKTSIALERVFWEVIDEISDGNWQSWLLLALQEKREGVGRATYLRSTLLNVARSGQLHKV